jgi:hypothetical protein
MKNFIILFFLFVKTLSIENKQFTKNSNVPLCRNCVYFKKHKYPDFFDLGKCTKFGKMDVVSGEIDYKYAYINRNNNVSCGNNGTYFEERKYENITLSILQNDW